MPITMPDGRIVHLRQYTTRIIRGSCPFEVAPDRGGCDLHVAAITVPVAENSVGRLRGATSKLQGDVVMSIGKTEVYRASARSLRDAWERVRRVDPENVAARLSREIDQFSAARPDREMRALAQKLVRAAEEIGRYYEDVNACVEVHQDEAALRATWPDAQKWTDRDKAAKAWRSWMQMLVGTVSIPVWVKHLPLRVVAEAQGGLEVEIHALHVAEVE